MKRPEFVTLIAVVATDMPIMFNNKKRCSDDGSGHNGESCRVLDEAISAATRY